MRRSLVVSVLLWSWLWSFGQSSPQPQAFRITLKLERPEAKAGQDVFVDIQLTNTSDHDINCSTAYVNGVDMNYDFDVRDAKGIAVKKSEVPSNLPGHFVLCTVAPGKSVTTKSRLSYTHALAFPGKYSIQAFKKAGGGTGGAIKSNVVSLTVVDPAPAPSQP